MSEMKNQTAAGQATDPPLATLAEIKDIARANKRVIEALRDLHMTVDTINVLHRFHDPLKGEWADVIRQPGGEPYVYLVYEDHTAEVYIERRERLGEKTEG
jgi:hypothetical protein